MTHAYDEQYLSDAMNTPWRDDGLCGQYLPF